MDEVIDKLLFESDEIMPEIPSDDIIEAPVDAVKEVEKQLTDGAVRQLIVTMHNLEHNMHHKALPEGFKRVRIEKLIVPISFDEHVVNICNALHIRPSTFYQGLMMDALTSYIEKIKPIFVDEEYTAELVNQLKPQDVGELLVNKIKIETERLNTLIKEGKYDENLSPSQNLQKFYPIEGVENGTEKRDGL